MKLVVAALGAALACAACSKQQPVTPADAGVPLPDAPAAPASPAASFQGGRVVITWSPSDRATAYQVWFAPAPGVVPGAAAVIRGAVSPQEQRDRPPATTWYYVV